MSLCAQTGLQPAPIVRQSPAQPSGAIKPRPNAGFGKPKGQHLAEWMNQHSSLNLQQQQQALKQEPGFHDLPPQTQQRMLDRLNQLNAMTPEKRQHILQTNEWMEHLNPDQRKQVRDATKQLADLPPDQRRYVARTFRGLRELTPAQRETVVNSDRFDHLTPEQRSTLNTLLKVEPLMPPPYDSGGPSPQQ